MTGTQACTQTHTHVRKHVRTHTHKLTKISEVFHCISFRLPLGKPRVRLTELHGHTERQTKDDVKKDQESV